MLISVSLRVLLISSQKPKDGTGMVGGSNKQVNREPTLKSHCCCLQDAISITQFSFQKQDLLVLGKKLVHLNKWFLRNVSRSSYFLLNRCKKNYYHFYICESFKQHTTLTPNPSFEGDVGQGTSRLTMLLWLTLVCSDLQPHSTLP